MISSKMTSYLLILLIGAACVTAELDDIVDDISAEEGDARTVFTSGGNYYIALNTTYLLYYAIIAGSLLLAGLALSSLFGGGAAETETGGYGQQYGYQQQQGYQGQQRQKRNAFDQNFTNQLYLLAEAFQKYEIEETGCQLYVACESSNVSKHQKNGRLAKLVYEVMSNLKTSENEDLYKDDQYMKDLMSAFKIGSIGSDCSKFRQMCRTEKVF